MDRFNDENQTTTGSVKNYIPQRINFSADKYQSTKGSRLSKKQVLALENEYSNFPYVTGVRRAELAKKLNLKDIQVYNWFRNRRNKAKTGQTQMKTNNQITGSAPQRKYFSSGKKHSTKGSNFSEKQILALQNEYSKSRYVTGVRRAELTEELNLSELQITSWYHNKRNQKKQTQMGTKAENKLHEQTKTVKDEFQYDMYKYDYLNCNVKQEHILASKVVCPVFGHANNTLYNNHIYNNYNTNSHNVDNNNVFNDITNKSIGSLDLPDDLKGINLFPFINSN